MNPRPPEPHSGALPDCATSRKTRRQGAQMPRRREKASPPGPTPSPKTVPGAGTSPLTAHIHSAAWRLGDCASSRSVRYRTALRPEKLDAEALRCRDAQERLPHPTQPLHRKSFRGKTSPLISHIHSAARRLSVYLHVSASRPSKPSAACTGRAVPDRLVHLIVFDASSHVTALRRK